MRRFVAIDDDAAWTVADDRAVFDEYGAKRLISSHNRAVAHFSGGAHKRCMIVGAGCSAGQGEPCKGA